MLYVLEGCDGAGKTTLAEQLSKLLDAEIIHCSTATPNDEMFFTHIIRMSLDKNIIADRWCYGQFVYQKPEDRPLCNIYSHPTLKGLTNVELQMLKAGSKVIYVSASEDTLVNRLAARNETLINGLGVSDILQRFDDIRKKSMLTWIDYRTD